MDIPGTIQIYVQKHEVETSIKYRKIHPDFNPTFTVFGSRAAESMAAEILSVLDEVHKARVLAMMQNKRPITPIPPYEGMG